MLMIANPVLHKLFLYEILLIIFQSCILSLLNLCFYVAMYNLSSVDAEDCDPSHFAVLSILTICSRTVEVADEARDVLCSGKLAGDGISPEQSVR